MITCKVGKNIIDTFSFKDTKLREWSNKSMLRCPVCEEKMLFCHGEYKIPYFRHEKNSDCPDIYSEGVTEEHLNGIKTLYEWLLLQDNIFNLQLEKWMPETHQRPDIYFERNEGNKTIKYVIEFQCSPIATKYNERHDLYILNDITDIWILGVKKYDIGRYESLIGIDGNDIRLDSIRTKTIEREVFESTNKLIYLNENTIYKIKERIDVGCKTKFDIIYDIHSNIDKNFEQLFKNDGLFIGNSKYNIMLDYLSYICELLNESVNNIYKYSSNYTINEKEIVFKVSRYYNDSESSLILNLHYNKISKEIIDSVYEIEIEKNKSIKDKLELFNHNLEEEIIKFNDRICENGDAQVTEYGGVKQIEVTIKNIKRFFKIYPHDFKITCNKWGSFSRYVGRSRRGNAKYETGYFLKRIEEYKINQKLDEKEVINIINNYFKTILFDKYSLILDKLLLNDDEVLEYKKLKTIKDSIENVLNPIINKFDDINKRFMYDVEIKSVNKIYISIIGDFNLDFEIDIVKNYIKIESSEAHINRTINNSINYMNRIPLIINKSLSDGLRNIKYNIR